MELKSAYEMDFGWTGFPLGHRIACLLEAAVDGLGVKEALGVLHTSHSETPADSSALVFRYQGPRKSRSWDSATTVTVTKGIFQPGELQLPAGRPSWEYSTSHISCLCKSLIALRSTWIIRKGSLFRIVYALFQAEYPGACVNPWKARANEDNRVKTENRDENHDTVSQFT